MDGFEYFRNMAYDAAWEHTEAATAEQNAAHKLPPVGDRAAWRAIMISGRDHHDNIGPEPEPVVSPGGRSQSGATLSEESGEGHQRTPGGGSAQGAGGGGDEAGSDSLDGEAEACLKCAPPSWETIARLKVSVAARLICDHGSWLANPQRVYDGGARWLFMLLARVDDVLDADTMSAVRHVLRVASQERCRLGAELASAGVDLVSEEVHHNNQLAQLNILITLCGKYFGQDDTLPV